MAVLLKKITIWVLNLSKLKPKKLKASTLIEALVASVIIIMVFTIASLTLNNVFKSTIKNDTHAIDTQLSKLFYLYQHHKIDKAYQDTFEDWDIVFSLQAENNVTYVVAEATQKSQANGHEGKKRTIVKKLIYEDAE